MWPLQTFPTAEMTPSPNYNCPIPKCLIHRQIISTTEIHLQRSSLAKSIFPYNTIKKKKTTSVCQPKYTHENELFKTAKEEPHQEPLQ